MSLILFYFFIFLIYFIDFLQRGRERDRELETSMRIIDQLPLAHTPPPGICPQPRYMPLTGIEPGTLQSAGQRSIHWAKPVPADVTLDTSPLCWVKTSLYEGLRELCHVHSTHSPLLLPPPPLIFSHMVLVGVFQTGFRAFGLAVSCLKFFTQQNGFPLQSQWGFTLFQIAMRFYWSSQSSSCTV